MLKYVPFTSINLSELSRWSPTSGTQIVVTNADFASSESQTDPVRGKVTPGSNPTNNSNQTAYSSIFNSNSGIALLSSAIDPDETDLQDTQVFAIGGGTPPAGGGTYTVNVNNYTFGLSASSYPNFIANPTATCNYNPANGGPNPFTCTTSTIGVGTVLTIRSYNTSDTTRTSHDPLTCTGSDGNVTYDPIAKDAYQVTYCKNYRVDSVSQSGVIGSPSPSDGALSESTSITFPLIANGNAINIGMVLQGETKTTNTCTYVCSKSPCSSNGNKYTYTITSASCSP